MEAENAIAEIIDSLVAQDVLVQMESITNAPIWPVKKKDGTYRLVIDFRFLNEATPCTANIVVSYPEVIAAIAEGAKWMLTKKENIIQNSTALTEFILLGLSDEPNLQSILFSTFLVVYIIILAGNLIIILLTFIDPALQTPMMLTKEENILQNSSALSGFILLGLSDEPNLQSILFSTFLVIYIIILAGNLIIILLTLVDPALQTPMYFFLRNLSFLEICYTSVNVPKMLENLLSGNKSISFLGCALETYFTFFLGGSECFLLASMSYDRYVAICKPLHYPVLMNRKVCMGLAVAPWLSGFFMSSGLTSMVFTMSFCGSNEINHFFCDIPPLLKLACGDTSRTEMAVFLVAMIFISFPFLPILLSYAGIIATILGMSSAEGSVFYKHPTDLNCTYIANFSDLLVRLLPQDAPVSTSKGNRHRDSVLTIIMLARVERSDELISEILFIMRFLIASFSDE
ncbi:PREDICTED: olfactory receptor 10A4-like [Gekko japonicus]|uniref:Olfactory receptor 10A4-like n=1 Tax=Gekko japonicus TaxID=146911 RepID=A0ABM1KNN1_GEKJA|nr:PREDICTED: olfactory receptor 10A4-like [Gekko japonicus]